MSSGQRLDLLENASATGSAFNWLGGRGKLLVEGTFGGATITLQVQSPNGTWLPVQTATAANTVNFFLPKGKIRAAVTGGPPSAMYVYAIAVPPG